MSYEKIVRGTVVTPQASIPGGWIAIDGETIREIGEGKPPAAPQVHDFGQSWIVPGGIDAQTHAGSYWGLAGLEPTSRAAICGGITTMVEMPFDNPTPLSSMELFQAKVQAVEITPEVPGFSICSTWTPPAASQARHPCRRRGGW